MNAKQKEVLQIHRNFVVKNIIWTEEFGTLLKTQGLISDSVMGDIMKCETREEKNKLLLERLTMKAGQAYHKFCNVLQVTGHYFLADFLRDEESNEPPNVKDLLKRLPFIAKLLKDNERKQIESYIIEKMQGETLKYAWKKDAKDKDKALDAKLKQLETEVLMQEKAKTATDQISNLKGTLMTATEECVVLKAQVNALKAEISSLRNQHHDDLNKQVKFNMANENSLKKLTEKVDVSEKALTKIRIIVRDAVSSRDHKTEKDIYMPRDDISYLMDDLNFLVSEFRKLIITERRYEDLVQECEWVIEQFGFKETDDLTLTKAYKEFIIQNQQIIEDLRKEIDKYDEMLRVQTDKMSFIENARDETDRKTANSTAIWQAAIMSVMRRQLQDTKASNRKKDSQILFLDEEVKKLKEKINKMENLLEEEKENNKRNAHIVVNEDIENMRSSIMNRDPQDKLYLKSLDSVNGDSSLVSDTATTAKSGSPRPLKVNTLPPLKYGSLKMVPNPSIPRVLKVRPQASIPRKYETRPFVGAPEGLLTSQLTLENRRSNPNGNGLSELKAFARHKGE